MPTPTASRRTGLQSQGKNIIEGQLNPDWVEALMGWPIRWTLLKPIKKLIWDFDWSEWEPEIPRVAKRVPNRVPRIKAIGNGQVPLCAAVAWTILTGGEQ